MQTNGAWLKLCFYVPESHLEATKLACFAAGAGRIGAYECCAWQTLGTGQFRPSPGANPFIGTVGEIETVPEYRVEMILAANLKDQVCQALRKSHPYETPAFDFTAVAIS